MFRRQAISLYITPHHYVPICLGRLLRTKRSNGEGGEREGVGAG